MINLIKSKTIICGLIVIFIVCIVINFTKIQNTILKAMYPKKYSYEVEKYSKEYNVDENLVYALIKAESNFDKNAVSKKDAKGLMQLMYDTALDISKTIGVEITNDSILDPDTNINIYATNKSLTTLFKNINESRAPIGSAIPDINVFLIALPLLSPE